MAALAATRPLDFANDTALFSTHSGPTRSGSSPSWPCSRSRRSRSCREYGTSMDVFAYFPIPGRFRRFGSLTTCSTALPHAPRLLLHAFATECLPASTVPISEVQDYHRYVPERYLTQRISAVPRGPHLFLWQNRSPLMKDLFARLVVANPALRRILLPWRIAQPPSARPAG
ncbi:hypothetical protein AMAG_20469 [Allomyces macrogynus ATCC 38327]|uniref:Uncharacterized protein n=1 Tax=Allomyces macrogynus (strain ATCC 38327) TaxID=578462 RepID=A0A0L0TB78_ALLM3|nr:hypothetical protein AMAG_20469 [Allomyces macrogynus ATCC 38327]|eukprot:KNE71844.1 hypothetical protein AMAG_20469 [Allomyces macrogynus ATCC 38327]